MVKNNLTFPDAVSVFHRFSMRYCGFCRFFLRGIVVLGTPQCPPPPISIHQARRTKRAYHQKLKKAERKRLYCEEACFK